MSNCTAFCKSTVTFVVAAAFGALVVAIPSPSMGQAWGTRAVGGVVVDSGGVVRLVTVAEQTEWVNRLRRAAAALSPELGAPTELRKVSLSSLERALAEAVTTGQPLADEVKYLAGLQRIQYVLVFPEQNDIVLAGPGEGWTVNDRGDVVGATTGKPVLRLDDLLVAFRTVEAARTESISVSIDPTPEGLRRFEQLMKRQKTFSRHVIAAIAEAIGPQQITYTGIPTNSHFARVLLAADHRMKRLAMNLDPSPLPGLPGYLDLLKAKRRLPKTTMPRWWMACNYEPLVRSEDKLVWELRGRGVKVLTEDEHLAADGTRQGTGNVDPIAKEWADRMTEHYGELADREIVFAELQNLMDLCVVAALISKEDLTALAGTRGFPLLASTQSGLELEDWGTPKSVPTKCSFLRIGRSYVITASGGVQIESWEVASRSKVDAAVKRVRAAAARSPDSCWWWN